MAAGAQDPLSKTHRNASKPADAEPASDDDSAAGSVDSAPDAAAETLPAHAILHVQADQSEPFLDLTGMQAPPDHDGLPEYPDFAHSFADHGAAEDIGFDVPDHERRDHGLPDHELPDHELRVPMPPKPRRPLQTMQAPQQASAQIAPAADVLTERALLASCLIDGDALPLAQAELRAGDFYDQRHAWIFEAMLQLVGRGQPIDAVSVNVELGRLKHPPVGMAYLLELSDAVGTTLAVEHHAKRISRLAAVRRILQVGQQLQNGFQPGDDPDEFIQQAESRVTEALRDSVRSAALPLSVIVDEVYTDIMAARARGGELLGIPSGFRELDRLTQGLHPTNLFILAARPAMGKTALALNIALDVAMRPRREPDKDGNLRHGVLVFSMEMGRDELVQRLLSTRSRIELTSLRKGNFAVEEEVALRDAAADLTEARFLIDDTPGLTTHDLRARAKLARMQGPLDLIVVDYLQLAKGTNPRQSREQEISEISRTLKGLAKELHCTVLALAQLNRGVEQRPNKRPMMSDLRESGAIEQDADVIAFIYRDFVYSKDPAVENMAELIVVKQRAGRTGDINLHFDGKFTRFSNLDERITDDYVGR